MKGSKRQASLPRTPFRACHNALFMRVLHKVPYDEKIITEFHAPDDVQLVFKPADSALIRSAETEARLS